jgi:2-dehydropantoate 2-reductase
MTATSRVLVAGCGAIGSVFGCLLRKAGHDVTLFGRDWHLRAIADHGLGLDGIWGKHHSEGFHLASKRKDLSGEYDLVIVAVKSYDTSAIVAQIRECVKADGIVLSAQNGLGNIECLGVSFGAERSLGANILVGAKLSAPACVTVTVQAAPIVIGPLEVSDCVMMERIHSWIRAFGQAQIPCEATPNILAYLWAKVFYNAPLNPLGALLHVHYGALGDNSELRDIMDGVIDEAFAVAAASDIDLLWPNSNEFRKFFYGHLLPTTYDHRSSMLQDLERGRRTEIDAINGQIWRYGQAQGIATPFNEILTRLIWQREKHPRPSDESWQSPSLLC